MAKILKCNHLWYFSGLTGDPTYLRIFIFQEHMYMSLLGKNPKDLHNIQINRTNAHAIKVGLQIGVYSLIIFISAKFYISTSKNILTSIKQQYFSSHKQNSHSCLHYGGPSRWSPPYFFLDGCGQSSAGHTPQTSRNSYFTFMSRFVQQVEPTIFSGALAVICQPNLQISPIIKNISPIPYH